MAKTIEFVLLLGMERYSRDFFRKVETLVQKDVPEFRLSVFEDTDTIHRPDELEAAIARCSCLFMVVVVMAEHAEFIVPTVKKHDPAVVFGFESLPEMMRLTKVGKYILHDSKGMPKSVQSLAKMLVGGREEDAYYGYLKMQKIAKKVVNFLPGKRLADFRNWTNVNAYWNNRSNENIANMIKLILREYLGKDSLHVDPPVEIPTMGFAHPDAPTSFAKPFEYERWERSRKGAKKNVTLLVDCWRQIAAISGRRTRQHLNVSANSTPTWKTG
jgi:magnesium chelatase subunit H